MVVIGRELDEEVPDEIPDVGHVPSNESHSLESESRQEESRQELLERLGRLLSAAFFVFARTEAL